VRKIFQRFGYFFHLAISEMGKVAQETIEEWSADKCPRVAAYLAFTLYFRSLPWWSFSSPK
jgi:uncharacterized BrkB/YihY/UPF0761 family membrane protein